MLQLDFKRNTFLWILGVTFTLGLGIEVVKLISRDEVNFPLVVVQDEESLELKRMADSIMAMRIAAASAPVNINTANPLQLETLDGIGPVLARRIVAYREAKGFFKSVEDLDEVSGIGPKRLAAIKDRCVVQ